MKKALLRLLMLFVGFSFLVALPACGDDKENEEPEEPKTLAQQLIGRWEETKLEEDEPPYILVLNPNQTGSISFVLESRTTLTFSQNFKWDAGIDSNGQGYFTLLTTTGDEILNDGQYKCILIDNELYLGGLRFKRK